MKAVTIVITIAVLVLITCSPSILQGENFFRSVETIPFSTKAEIPDRVYSFSLTDDELIITPDMGKKILNIYEQKGKYLELVGKIGEKDDLIAPVYCSYSQPESRLVVYDFGLKKVLIYKRDDRIEFTRIEKEEFYCPLGGSDFKLTGTKVLISGAVTENGEEYSLYYVDTVTKQTVTLLPAFYKFGFNRKSETPELGEYKGRGVSGWIDIRDNNFLNFIWEGNTRVITLDIEKGVKSLRFFGKEPRGYVKPFVSDKLREARKNDDVRVIREEKARMSYVRNTFSNAQYIFVVVEGDGKFILQVYDLNGNWINDVEFPGQPDYKMVFISNNDGMFIYSLNLPKRKQLIKYRAGIEIELQSKTRPNPISGNKEVSKK